jgi:hypothetical protein
MSETNAASDAQGSPEISTESSAVDAVVSSTEVVSSEPTTTPEASNHPEWFMHDKYKSIEEQAKAQFDMTKLMGKNWGVPKDDYTIDGIDGIVKDDPLLTHLKPALKELGLSQEGFAHLIKSYQDANVKLGKSIEEAVSKELTQKDALTVQAVDRWLTDAFTAEDKKTIQSWIVSVDDFKVLNQLRVLLPSSSNVPSSTQGQAVRYESTQEVENDKIKYRKELLAGKVADKNYEDALQQRWKDAYVRQNRG